MNQSFTFKTVVLVTALSALTIEPASAGPVDGWYVNSNTNGTLINGQPGDFRYVLGPGGNAVLADVGPYPLTVGGSLTFSGTVTNNVSTLLWNDIQLRWGILDSNGNPFHGFPASMAITPITTAIGRAIPTIIRTLSTNSRIRTRLG